MTYPISLKTVILFFLLAIISVSAWELHWRSKGYNADVGDDKYLWSANRAKVEKLGSDDVVLIGSSRVLFDIQLDEWQKELGMRPVMLAIPGSSPTPVFQDLVENSDFIGTVIFGITPPLFFTPPSPEMEMWKRPSKYVEQYHKGTYAQKFSHYASVPLQKSFAFIHKADDDMYTNLDLKTLINSIQLEQRIPTHPPFPQFASVDEDRNVTMYDIVSQDTAYANTIKRVWQFYGGFAPPPEVLLQVAPVINGYVNDLVVKFKARGGKVIFLRCPSSDHFREAEKVSNPREHFWDALLATTNCPGYHFEDYDFLNKYVPPESSHLKTSDAKTFTTDLCRLLKKDGHF
jgi:hypothetical protein